MDFPWPRRRSRERPRHRRLGRLRGDAERSFPLDRRRRELAGDEPDRPAGLPDRGSPGERHRGGAAQRRLASAQSLHFAGRGTDLDECPGPELRGGRRHRPRAPVERLRRLERRLDLEVDGRRCQLAAHLDAPRQHPGLGSHARLPCDVRTRRRRLLQERGRRNQLDIPADAPGASRFDRGRLERRRRLRLRFRSGLPECRFGDDLDLLEQFRAFPHCQDPRSAGRPRGSRCAGFLGRRSVPQPRRRGDLDARDGRSRLRLFSRARLGHHGIAGARRNGYADLPKPGPRRQLDGLQLRIEGGQDRRARPRPERPRYGLGRWCRQLRVGPRPLPVSQRRPVVVPGGRPSGT